MDLMKKKSLKKELQSTHNHPSAHLTEAHTVNIFSCFFEELFTGFSTLCACVLSCVPLFATSWTVDFQVSVSLEFPSKNTGVGGHFLLQEIFVT